MRPSISVSLEPGLERGVPWGRDLYTFVTSAAGHMMRTLQKPRKNRPSKRQVNHRRFLHNMIQRKFADIEAANHRLASALYFNGEEKTLSSLQLQKPEAESCSKEAIPKIQRNAVFTQTLLLTLSLGLIYLLAHIKLRTVRRSTQTLDIFGNGIPSHSPPPVPLEKNNQGKGRKKTESGNHKLVEFTSFSSPTGTDYYGAELFHTEFYNNESPLKSINNLSEDTQTAPQNSSFIQFGHNVDTSPPFSPELSPLSLDSCDFSIQMFTDISTCAQAQKSIADIAESPWTDIMDLFSVSNKDSGGCVDVDAYFESICACQGDEGPEVGAEDLTFADQSDSFTERMCSNRSDVEDLHCERAEHRYEYLYSCHGDQGSTINHAAETQFNSFKPSQCSDIPQNQLPASISCQYNVSHLQMYQQSEEESLCVLANLNFTPFEGVAQSFSAPLHNPEHRPIPTPPHEDDWLFTDILKDRTDC